MTLKRRTAHITGMWARPRAAHAGGDGNGSIYRDAAADSAGLACKDGQSRVNSYCSDEEAARCMPWHAHKSVQQTERDLRERLCPGRRTKTKLPLADCKKQRLQQVIGNIGGAFLHVAACPELGYVLGRAWWNKGYMSERWHAVVEYLFTCTPVHRIAPGTRVGKPASGAVLGKSRALYTRKKFSISARWIRPAGHGALRILPPLKSVLGRAQGSGASQREE